MLGRRLHVQGGQEQSDRRAYPLAFVAALPWIHLPRYSPQLNPVENIWKFLRHNDLSNRIYATYEAIADACWVAWNKLIAAPERIRSIVMRGWTKTVSS